MNVENVYLVFGREIKYGQKNYSPNDNHVDSGELLCVNATLRGAQTEGEKYFKRCTGREFHWAVERGEKSATYTTTFRGEKHIFEVIIKHRNVNF